MLPREAEGLLGQARFVDVREPYEFSAGHIEDSIHIPIGEIPTRFEELRGDEKLVIVCQVGQRSALVAEFLRGQGMDAHNLEGGLQRWAAEGLPLTAPDGSGRLVDGWARDLSGQRVTWDGDLDQNG